MLPIHRIVQVLAGAVLYLSSNALAFGAELPISLNEIESVFGYPAHKLVIQDVTEQVNRRAEAKGRGTVLSSHVVSSVDNTFARVSVDIAPESTLLTSKLLEGVEQSITKSAASGVQSSLQWLTLGDAGYGVAGLGIVGPGGSQERVALT